MIKISDQHSRVKRFLWWCRRMRELIIRIFSDFNLPLFILHHFLRINFPLFRQHSARLCDLKSLNQRRASKLWWWRIFITPREILQKQRKFQLQNYSVLNLSWNSLSSRLNFKQEISRSSDDLESRREFSCLFWAWKMCSWRQTRRLSRTSKGIN